MQKSIHVEGKEGYDGRAEGKGKNRETAFYRVEF
jgi:hypothetical protein